MLNESPQKPKARRQQNTHKKKTGWNNDVQIETEKGKEEKKNKINKQQERKKGDSTQIAGEGVAPRRNNRITEPATKESREEAKRKNGELWSYFTLFFSVPFIIIFAPFSSLPPTT